MSNSITITNTNGAFYMAVNTRRASMVGKYATRALAETAAAKFLGAQRKAQS